MPITITLENTPKPEDVKTVKEGLSGYNRRHAEDDAYTPFAIFLRDKGEKVIGGLLGGTYWGWLTINILWIDASLRGQGYGTQLLAMAEDEGRKRGCKNAHLDTMSFQALEFYQKHGYTLWGTLEGIPAGHNRHFLRKGL